MLWAFVVIVVSVSYTSFLGAVTMVVGVLDRSGRLPHRVIRAWAQALLVTGGVKVEVRGAEHIVGGPTVFAANHNSALDIPLLFGYLPADFRIIYKRSLSFVPFMGWGMLAAGHIPIDRRNAFRSRQTLAATVARIRGGTNVVVFPEGSRSRDGRLQAFKRGSFVLALDAGVPVTPVTLEGVRPLVPRGITSLRRGTVRLTVHPPIPTAGRSRDEAQAVANEVREVVRAHLGEPA